MMASPQYGSTTTTNDPFYGSGNYQEIPHRDPPKLNLFWWPRKYREGLMWKRLIAIRGWFLILPAVGVLTWGLVKLLGRAFFGRRSPGPQPLRYVSEDQERAERERIKDHNKAAHVETDRVADGAQKGLDDFLGDSK